MHRLLVVAALMSGCGDRSGAEHVPVSAGIAPAECEPAVGPAATTPAPSQLAAHPADAERACEGIHPFLRSECPIGPASVIEERDTTDGVELTLGDVGLDEAALEQRIVCYRATRALTRVESPIACALDHPDVEADVEERNGHLYVNLARTAVSER